MPHPHPHNDAPAPVTAQHSLAAADGSLLARSDHQQDALLVALLSCGPPVLQHLQPRHPQKSYAPTTVACTHKRQAHPQKLHATQDRSMRCLCAAGGPQVRALHGWLTVRPGPEGPVLRPPAALPSPATPQPASQATQPLPRPSSHLVTKRKGIRLELQLAHRHHVHAVASLDLQPGAAGAAGVMQMQAAGRSHDARRRTPAGVPGRRTCRRPPHNPCPPPGLAGPPTSIRFSFLLMSARDCLLSTFASSK